MAIGDVYATHLEALSQTMFKVPQVLESNSPIYRHRPLYLVELGCGHYSTPLLISCARHYGLQYVRFVQDTSWAKETDGYLDPAFCETRVVPGSWDEVVCPAPAALVLIDREGKRNRERAVHLHRTSFQAAAFLVVHDWETIRDAEAEKHFAHFRLYDRLVPTTAVFSNVFSLH